jgi:hypothetical protein
MKKYIVTMLMIAAVTFAVFAVLPIRLAHCEDDDPFQYSYPIVQNPDFAFVGELAPGASTPWVNVIVTFTGPATPPVTSIGPWQAEVPMNGGGTAYWTVTAEPIPTYTWPSLTSSVEVKIKVTVPSDWTEECDHTFNVKLLGGKDSKTPTPRTISPGDGVHFKVCVKIPPQHHFSLECDSFMTDSSFNRITSFDTVWTPKDPKGRDTYKLASTNPGQFMFNIWIHNNGDIDAESLTVTYVIPSDFELKGADPIQVWTGYGKTGTRIYTVQIVAGTITITSGLAVGDELSITFHLEYGPARGYFDKATMLAWKTNHASYTFSDDCIGKATGYPDVNLHQDTELYDPTVVLGAES